MTMVKKWSVVVNGKQTTLSLEDEFWSAFKMIASATGTSRRNILTELSKQHTNLSSAVRLAVLTYYVERAKSSQQSPGIRTVR